MDEKVLGIYLGTHYSAACVCINGKPTMIPSAEEYSMYGKAFPSYVAFNEDGMPLVGQPAKDQAIENPDNTISEISRYLGTNYKFSIRGKEYSPQEISAMILQKIKRDAESFLGDTITKAVITVPAYFGDNQRIATKDAGTIAGLEVLQLINEPIAACLAYGIDKQDEEDVNILVFDLGGGTLDVTIMEFGSGIFIVKSTSGNTQLGGTDMDNVLINYLADEFKNKHGIDLKEGEDSRRRLREGAEKAKIELSNLPETNVKIPYIALSEDFFALHLDEKLSRSKLEELVRPIVEKCGESIDQAIQDADLTIDEIDKVILLCETKEIFILQDYLERYFGVLVEKGLGAAECMAIGASIKGSMFNENVSSGVIIDFWTPFSLSVVIGGSIKVMIEKLSALPVEHSEIFTTVQDNQRELSFEIVLGENRNPNLNKSLGSFVLDGIRPAPKGVPQIEVTFEVDEDGVLDVIATDLATGNTKSITIASTYDLTQEEIKRLNILSKIKSRNI